MNVGSRIVKHVSMKKYVAIVDTLHATGAICHIIAISFRFFFIVMTNNEVLYVINWNGIW